MAEQWDATREIKCELCGETFEADGTVTACDASFPLDGIREEFTPDSTRCDACADLGQAPPKSPCCSMRLYWQQEADDEHSYACEGCDTIFPLSAIRHLALGIEVERIVRDGEPECMKGAVADLLRASARLGIRRGEP